MKRNIQYGLILFVLVAACKPQPEIKPQRKDIVDAVFASGKLYSEKQFKITAFTEGYLLNSMVAEGDTIKPGQSLFKLQNDVQQTQVQNALVNYQFAQENAADNSPQLTQLQQQINQSLKKKQTDSINLNRYENLIKTNAVAKADYDKVLLEYQNDVSTITVQQKQLADLRRTLALNVANTKAQYEIQMENNHFYLLTAQSGGVILTVYKKNGDLVKKGETIADAGSGKIIAKLDVAEDDIQRVQMNQLVLVSLNTEKATVYQAKVTKIYPFFSESTQSFTVEASFTEMPPQLKDGTKLQANFIISEKKNALVIPAAYVLEGDSVMVKGAAKKLYVKLGIKTLEWAEIISGLTENDVLTIK